MPHDLFSTHWPPIRQFPLNNYEGNVRSVVEDDIQESSWFIIVTGFTSLSNIIDTFGKLDWTILQNVKVVLGFEPDPRGRQSYQVDNLSDEIRDYWLEHGYSPFKSGLLLKVVELIESGKITFKIQKKLHAKIYIGEFHGTIGSSNFTKFGLETQTEANIRVQKSSVDPTEKRQYDGLLQIANNFYNEAEDYQQQILSLLNSLIKPVTWQEALSRAVSEVLTGGWINDYPKLKDRLNGLTMWPTQRVGLARSLFVLQNQGNALIADPTGSGKTRMIAALQLALIHWHITEGKIDKLNSLVICPKVVETNWKGEQLSMKFGLSGLVSMGILSNAREHTQTLALSQLKISNTLVIDEAHNFLNRKSKRSDFISLQSADHIILSTATPINKKVEDLLRLVELLDVDNLNDEELDEFQELKRTYHRGDSAQYITQLRDYIKKFTIRRTKKELNDHIDKEPEAYRNRKGELCRFPKQTCTTYPTEESDADKAGARKIQELARQLKGLIFLRRLLQPEDYQITDLNEQKIYVDKRLKMAQALAQFMIQESLRSSKVALVEHLEGTTISTEHFNFKSNKSRTGNIIGKLKTFQGSLPQTDFLGSVLPSWYTDQIQYDNACADEINLYSQISKLAKFMSDSREKGKVSTMIKLREKHGLLLAFDSTSITLDYLKHLMSGNKEFEVYVARGSNKTEKEKLVQDFALESSKDKIIALCSDALSEGVNLQKASAVMFLDMPSVLRIAEQRVGRIHRMDSPHAEIHSYWPNDADEFALKSDRRLIKTTMMAGRIIGNNLDIPDDLVDKHLDTISAGMMIEDYETLMSKEDEQWFGISDAFQPIRDLVEGDTNIIPTELYNQYINSKATIRCGVSYVESTTNWGFFAYKSRGNSAPRWNFLDNQGKLYSEFPAICTKLRECLNPKIKETDWRNVQQVFQQLLLKVKSNDRDLLPNKKRRALEVAQEIVKTKLKIESDVVRGRLLHQLLKQFGGEEVEDTVVDYNRLSELWLELLQPIVLERRRNNKRYKKVISLHSLRKNMKEIYFTTEQLENILSTCPRLPTLDYRLTVCIIGVGNTKEFDMNLQF